MNTKRVTLFTAIPTYKMHSVFDAPTRLRRQHKNKWACTTITCAVDSQGRPVGKTVIKVGENNFTLAELTELVSLVHAFNANPRNAIDTGEVK